MARSLDMTGMIYKSWKILERAGTSNCGFATWLCECKCGNKKIFAGREIRIGKTRKDCGCSESWIGRRFGRLTVLKIGPKGNHNNYVLCKCDCGNEKEIWGTTLHQGRCRSCGCIVKEKGKKRGLNGAISLYKRHAKERNLIFSLTECEFLDLCKKDCFYCGKEPSNRLYKQNKDGTEMNFIYNGIDRIENTIGYVLENCVPCCKICNYMKRETSFSQWKKHMELILENLNSREAQPAGAG